MAGKSNRQLIHETRRSVGFMVQQDKAPRTRELLTNLADRLKEEVSKEWVVHFNGGFPRIVGPYATQEDAAEHGEEIAARRSKALEGVVEWDVMLMGTTPNRSVRAAA